MGQVVTLAVTYTVICSLHMGHLTHCKTHIVALMILSGPDYSPHRGTSFVFATPLDCFSKKDYGTCRLAGT